GAKMLAQEGAPEGEVLLDGESGLHGIGRAEVMGGRTSVGPGLAAAGKLDRAVRGRKQPADDPQQRGLSDTVRTGHQNGRSGSNLERKVRKNQLPTAFTAEVCHGKAHVFSRFNENCLESLSVTARTVFRYGTLLQN